MSSTYDLILDARVQLRALLDEHPGAADVLRERLMDGRIDGGRYWSGKPKCGCPLGTVAFAEDASDPRSLATGLAFTHRFDDLEDWAWPISLGDVEDHTQPEDSGPFRAALLVSWIDEWKAERA